MPTRVFLIGGGEEWRITYVRPYAYNLLHLVVSYVWSRQQLAVRQAGRPADTGHGVDILTDDSTPRMCTTARSH